MQAMLLTSYVTLEKLSYIPELQILKIYKQEG